MKFEIDTATLQRVVKVLGVVARVNVIDSTGRLLMETDKDNIVFTVNNGATDITISTPALSISEPGKLSIVYGKIKSFVSSYKPWNGTSGVKKFRINSTEKSTFIKVDNFYGDGKAAKSSLKLVNSNPALLQKSASFENTTFILNSTIFRTATNKVLYAIDPSMDFSLMALQGMNMSFDGNDIYFVGANGKVLSECQIKNTGEYNECNITLQYDFIMGLRRLLRDDIQLFWEIKGNRILVKFDDIVYSGRHIVGHEYPVYKNSFDDYTSYINFNKELLLETVRPFVDVLEPEDNFRLTFEVKDKIIRLFNEQGSVELEQDIQGGIDYTIDINGKFFIQTIESINDTNIILKFSDENGLLIFDASTTNDQKSLIMPLSKR